MVNAALGSARFRTPYRDQPPLTLFCDFDGPIVDVSNRYYHTYQLGLEAVQSLYKQQGIYLRLNPLSKDQFWQMKQERTPDVEIAMRSGLQNEQIDRFLEQVTTIVNQPDLLGEDQLQPGVKWALALLHSQGVKLVLVTLRRQSQAIQILRNYGLDSLFSQIWGTSNDQAAYLNQAEHKTQLLKQAIAETKATSAWMVGDTEADVLAGQATSTPTIALTCGIRSRAYLQRFQPTRIHSDLLSAAHYLTCLIENEAVA